MKIIKYSLITLFICIFSLSAFATETSTNIFYNPNTAPQNYKCYGTSQTSTQTGGSYRTDWWRCDGINVSNEYIQCATGYVSTGVYTWKYTAWDGSWISRCQVACTQITTTQPESNCAWRAPGT